LDYDIIDIYIYIYIYIVSSHAERDHRAWDGACYGGAVRGPGDEGKTAIYIYIYIYMGGDPQKGH
jgi:hypothetical protein